MPDMPGSHVLQLPKRRTAASRTSSHIKAIEQAHDEDDNEASEVDGMVRNAASGNRFAFRTYASKARSMRRPCPDLHASNSPPSHDPLKSKPTNSKVHKSRAPPHPRTPLNLKLTLQPPPTTAEQASKQKETNSTLQFSSTPDQATVQNKPDTAFNLISHIESRSAALRALVATHERSAEASYQAVSDALASLPGLEPSITHSDVPSLETQPMPGLPHLSTLATPPDRPKHGIRSEAAQTTAQRLRARHALVRARIEKTLAIYATVCEVAPVAAAGTLDERGVLEMGERRRGEVQPVKGLLDAGAVIAVEKVERDLFGMARGEGGKKAGKGAHDSILGEEKRVVDGIQEEDKKAWKRTVQAMRFGAKENEGLSWAETRKRMEKNVEALLRE